MNQYQRIYNKTYITHFKSLFILEMTHTHACRLLVEEVVEEVVEGPWREETMNSGRSRFPHPEEETHNAVTQTVRHSGRKGLSLGLYQICEILDPVRHPLLPERRGDTPPSQPPPLFFFFFFIVLEVRSLGARHRHTQGEKRTFWLFICCLNTMRGSVTLRMFGYLSVWILDSQLPFKGFGVYF